MIEKKLVIKSINKQEKFNLILFSVGKFISVFGTSIYTFAMSLYILEKTGSGLPFATNLALGTVPSVIMSPIVGILVDRLNRKYLVVFSDVVNGLLFICVYFIINSWELDITIIYISTLITSILMSISNISIEASKPNIVTECKLITINSISKTIESVSTILGPMVGGVIIGLIDIKLFIGINALSFIVAALLEIFIDFRLNVKLISQKEGKNTIKEDILTGFRYIANNKILKRLILAFASVNFIKGLSIIVPLPFILKTVLRFTPQKYGLIQSFFPMGMILGSIIVKKFIGTIKLSKLLLIMFFSLSICMIMIGIPVLVENLFTNKLVLLLYYCFTVGLLGLTMAFIDIPLFYKLQIIIPNKLLGRVLSAGIGLAHTIAPIGIIVSGFLINQNNPYMLPIMGGLFQIIIVIILYKVNYFSLE